MRLSLLFALTSPLLVLAQSSTSTSSSTSPSSASANATATPSNNSTGNSTLQTLTTTITSLIPVPSGSTSATSTSLLTLTLTLNASSPAPSSTNATINGTAPLGNGTANATEPAQWKEGDDWIPFHIRIDPAYGVLGAVLILTGIPVAGLGGKNRWSSLAIVSGYALMLFTLVMILRFGVQVNLQPPSPSPPSTTLRGLYLLACIVAGFIGAGIGIFLFNISKHFVAAAGGFAFGWFLLALKSGGLLTSMLGRWGLLGGLTVGALVVSIVPRTALLMVLISTAWIGATAVMLGVDCYTRAGLKEFYMYNLGFHSLFPKLGGAKYPLTQTMIIELGLLAAIVLIGGAIQARVLNRIQKRLREARLEEEMRIEAEEVARAAERFKNVGSDLREWEEKHGNGQGVVELDPSQTLHDGATAHLPILAREQVTTQQRPSSPHLPPIDTGSRPLHEELQIDSDPSAAKRDTATPSTITFHGVEELKDEPATSRTRTGQTSPVAVDPELEEKMRLLEEVRKARESIRGSIDELHRQTPTSTMGTRLDTSRPVTPSYSLGAMSDGMSRMSMGSHKADELDLRTRRASAASSRVLDGPDSARMRPQLTTHRLINAAHSRDSSGGSGEVLSSQNSPADWDRYVSDRKITIPSGPADVGARYPPQDGFDKRGMAVSMVNLSGPSSSHTSSEDRRTRTTSVSMPSEDSGLGQYKNVPPARSRDSYSRTDSYGPGQVTGSASHRHSATMNPRAQSRSMTYEELADRHRKHISALQSTVSDEAKEEEKVRTARERWERQKRDEKAEMERKERHAMAAKSNKKDKGEQREEVLKSTDEWRRSVHVGLDQLGRPVNPPAHPRDRSQSRGDPTRPRDKRTSSMIN